MMSMMGMAKIIVLGVLAAGIRNDNTEGNELLAELLSNADGLGSNGSLSQISMRDHNRDCIEYAIVQTGISGNAEKDAARKNDIQKLCYRITSSMLEMLKRDPLLSTYPPNCGAFDADKISEEKITEVTKAIVVNLGVVGALEVVGGVGSAVGETGKVVGKLITTGVTGADAGLTTGELGVTTYDAFRGKETQFEVDAGTPIVQKTKKAAAVATFVAITAGVIVDCCGAFPVGTLTAAKFAAWWNTPVFVAGIADQQFMEKNRWRTFANLVKEICRPHLAVEEGDLGVSGLMDGMTAEEVKEKSGGLVSDAPIEIEEEFFYEYEENDLDFMGEGKKAFKQFKSVQKDLLEQHPELFMNVDLIAALGSENLDATANV